MKLTDAIDRIRPSVVQINAMGPGLPPQGATLGTGFVVTEARHVVTARHVIDAIDFAGGQSVNVAFAGPDVDTPGLRVRASFVGTQGEVEDSVAEHDLALIEVPAGSALTGDERGHSR